ncbi:MAG TPA: trehalase family glycosidase, partial [Polyangiaceae bacterium]|nr:trehalase family glycosidase [Polyangiaceae bacterium]
SYFTMLGLEASGRHDLVLAMLRNFAALIERFGHVPNGNRNYYLSRSQPPFFSHMVELAAEEEGPQIYGAYLRQLKLEHDYWMRGLEGARRAARDAGGTGAAQRVVVLPGDVILNRYWDDRDTPRSEAYAIDEATARAALSRGRSAQEVYRDLRAAAESGWDFSSRWFDDDLTLAGIRTTAIVPIDLNSLLFHLEQTIAKACEQHHEPCAETYEKLADQRARAIARYLWNEHGYYADYDWRKGKLRENVTAAMLFPLFIGIPSIAERERAERTADTAEALLLKAGGLTTTTRTTDPRQQWDAPNGWAPLQWIAVVGLNRYGQTERAREIATRFLTRVRAVFACNHELTEKYDVEVESDAEAVGSGGEYEPQNGFGWTNGVTLKLWELYPPTSAAMECRRAPAEPLARKRYERPSVSCPAAPIPAR